MKASRAADTTATYETKKELSVDGTSYMLTVVDSGVSKVKPDDLLAADGFLCLFSIVDKESFNAVTPLREQLLVDRDAADTEWTGGEDTVPMVIVGNKVDLDEERVVPSKDGSELGTKHGCLYVETSAKARIRVEETFCLLVREIRKSKRGADELELGGNVSRRRDSATVPPRRSGMCALL